MIYIFHPAAEAEFLETVGYYTSKVPGLGNALITEFEAIAELIAVSPKVGKLKLNPIFVERPSIAFLCPSFIVRKPAASRFWRLLTSVADRNTGSIGFREPLAHEDVQRKYQTANGRQAIQTGMESVPFVAV